MAIKPSLLGGWTPICNDCGVALCWDISEQEYEKNKNYWENWKCKECDPAVVGSWIKYRANKSRVEKK